MAKVTPTEFVEKWQRRTSAATPDYVRGIQRVQTAPGQQAAQQKALYLARIQEKANVWANNVSAVSLGDWQRAATEVGAQRISQGVQGATGKMNAIAGNLLAAVDAAASKVKSMPKDTLEARIARSAEFQRAMAASKVKR